MNKISLLERAKKLNIPHRNRMKTKEELSNTSSQFIRRLFLVRIPPPVWRA